MESHKKQTSDLPLWERILAKARSESVPEIDVRPGVRAVLESQLRSGAPLRPASNPGLVEGILELFARPAAKFGLGFAAISVFAFAVTLATRVDQTELGELVFTTDELAPVIDESAVEHDWSEIL